MRRRPPGESGITLVEIAAAVTVVGIIVALLVPAWVCSSRFQKVLACEGHLHALYDAQAKAPAPGSKQLGSEYWTRLTQTSPPLVAPDALRCPFVDAADPSPCQYYGPSADPANAQPKDPIGCDREQNHGEDGKEGGNVLLKSGQVVTDHTGIWGSATRQGKCRP